MEAAAVILIIIVLALILGVKPIFLIIAGAVVIGLLIVMMALLFAFFFAKLITSQKREALFSHIGKKTNGRFKAAFYIIDGVEYPNVFPEEGLLEDKLYKNEKKYNVFLNKSGYVFDRFAAATCIIGFFVSLALTAAAIFAAAAIL